MKGHLPAADDDSSTVGRTLPSTGSYTPHGEGKFFFTMMAAFAELERDIIHERTMAGLAAARAQGKVGGRPTAMDPDKLAAARARRERGENPAQIAKSLSVSRASVYRHLGAGSQETKARHRLAGRSPRTHRPPVIRRGRLRLSCLASRACRSSPRPTTPRRLRSSRAGRGNLLDGNRVVERPCPGPGPVAVLVAGPGLDGRLAPGHAAGQPAIMPLDRCGSRGRLAPVGGIPGRT